MTSTASLPQAAAATALQTVMAAAAARAADGDYKTKGVGHEVKDADGDYKSTAAPSSATSTTSSAALAVLSALKRGD